MVFHEGFRKIAVFGSKSFRFWLKLPVLAPLTACLRRLIERTRSSGKKAGENFCHVSARKNAVLGLRERKLFLAGLSGIVPGSETYSDSLKRVGCRLNAPPREENPRGGRE